MRSEKDDMELRSLINEILDRVNSVTALDRFEAHAYGANFEIAKSHIRHVWETYFSSGQIQDSDSDLLAALKFIQSPFWPQEIYLEAALAISEALHCPVITQIPPEQLNSESRFLLEYQSDKTSQTGEEGICTQIFEIMGIKNSWCVEFGAWDGQIHSNTNNLITSEGWRGVLIESDVSRFNELSQTYRGNDRVCLFNQMVGFDAHVDSIDFILGKTDAPRDLDFMVVDIDGNDWHIWDSMEAYRPRLIMVEINPTIPNDILYIQERNPEHQRGCSLRALIELGKSKGYELICASTFNGFFVKSEEFDKFGITDNSIDAMYAPVADGRIFHGYDSSIHVVGMPKLMWDWRGYGRDWARELPERVTVYKDW